MPVKICCQEQPVQMNHLSQNILMEVQTHLVFGLGLIVAAVLMRRLGSSPGKDNLEEKALKISSLQQSQENCRTFPPLILTTFHDKANPSVSLQERPLQLQPGEPEPFMENPI